MLEAAHPTSLTLAASIHWRHGKKQISLSHSLGTVVLGLFLGFASGVPGGRCPAALVTNVYQNALNGYAGTADVSISTQNGQYTGGNGDTETVAGQYNPDQWLGVYQIAEYEARILLRFGQLNLPPGPEVTTTEPVRTRVR